MKKQEQIHLFELKESWEEHWQDMPEFVAENKKPCQQIIVSFRDKIDVDVFAKKLGLTVTPKTNSTWYPARPIDTGYIYVNENWGKNEK